MDGDEKRGKTSVCFCLSSDQTTNFTGDSSAFGITASYIMAPY